MGSEELDPDLETAAALRDPADGDVGEVLDERRASRARRRRRGPSARHGGAREEGDPEEDDPEVGLSPEAVEIGKPVDPSDAAAPLIRKPCINNCGWTAFQDRDTRCRRCGGPDGPHNHDCWKKNEKLSRHRRKNMLSKREKDDLHKKQAEAIEEVKKATSGQELLDALDVFVDEAWSGGIDELEGNIYRAAAFGSFPWPSCDCSCGDEEWSAPPCIWRNAKFFGGMCIWLTQIIGPFFMLYQNVKEYEDWQFSLDPWAEKFGEKLVGLTLLCMFNLNAYFEVTRESQSWEKISSLFVALECHHKRNTSHFMLTVGCITNCYVFISSCICTTLVMGAAESVQDVLFDALAILFLYNLDDINSGQVSFVTPDDWPGSDFAWLYQEISSKGEVPQPGRAKYVYSVTRVCIGVLSLTLPVFFVFSSVSGGE